MDAIDTRLDQLITAKLGPRLDAALERALARMLGETAPAAAPQTAPSAHQGKKTRSARRRAAKGRQTGPTPGSAADGILRALADGPLTESEFAKALESVPGSHEARRQAVTRLTKAGRLVVVDDGKRGRQFRLGSETRPTTGG